MLRQFLRRDACHQFDVQAPCRVPLDLVRLPLDASKAEWKPNWAFACKVMTGASPKSLFDRTLEGTRQIKRSTAERGCVIVNLKNRFDHRGFWPILNEEDLGSGASPVFGAQVSLASAVERLRMIG